MLYQAYQNQSDLMSPLRLLAQMTGSQMATQHAGAGLMAQLIGLSPFLPPASSPSSQRKLAAAMEVFSRMRLTHSRPAFGITSVVSGGEEVAVTEVAVRKAAFGTLLHFKKDMPSPKIAPNTPKVKAKTTAIIPKKIGIATYLLVSTRSIFTLRCCSFVSPFL